VTSAGRSPVGTNTPSLTAERPEERYVARWRQAWSHGAVEPCLNEHATTIRDERTLYLQPLFDAVTGEEGMRRMFERIFALIPDLSAELDHWVVDEGIAFIEFTLTGTLGGKPIRWRAVDRMQLDGEKLAMRETYYDPLPVLIALLSRPRSWPRALRALQLRTLPRLRPSRTTRPRSGSEPGEAGFPGGQQVSASVEPEPLRKEQS
jgi:SnoaL-like domain